MPAAVTRSRAWYTDPTVIIVSGCIVAAISFGVRSSMGLFTQPISDFHHVGPRGLRHGDGRAESRVGGFSAHRRRLCRPLRHGPRAHHRRHHLCRGRGAHVGVAPACLPLPFRRPASRHRDRHRFVLDRDGRLRPSRTARETLLGLRHSHRGRLAGPVHLRARWARPSSPPSAGRRRWCFSPFWCCRSSPSPCR